MLNRGQVNIPKNADRIQLGQVEIRIYTRRFRMTIFQAIFRVSMRRELKFELLERMAKFFKGVAGALVLSWRADGASGASDRSGSTEDLLDVFRDCLNDGVQGITVFADGRVPLRCRV